MDEGTVFASGSFNVTYVPPLLTCTPFKLVRDLTDCDLYHRRTEDEFRSYVHQFFFPRAPQASIHPVFELYPDDPTQGSPFGTGDANQLAPMFKRMSAFQGDMIFQAPKRFFLDQRSSKQSTWAFGTRHDC